MSKSVREYRSIFVSDVHLGTRGCKAELLLDFLKHADSENLFLVGDIVDGWRLQRSWYWAPSHADVVQELLRKARHGTRVVYVPGNHDEGLRAYCGDELGRIEIVRDTVHEAADGRRLLVFHGDELDTVVQHARWLAHVGDLGYQAAVVAGQALHRVRHRFGRPYWSLAGYLKCRVKKALDHLDGFERAAAAHARHRGCDGVVAGHVHTAALRDVDGITYANDGDWVDSCTALVEHFDGRLEIVDWMSERANELTLAGATWTVAAARLELDLEPG